MRRRHITSREILRWADAFYLHWDRWPTRDSGNVEGEIDLTWCGIDIALRHGNRGLPGGSSLAQLLAERRGVRNRMRLSRFTIRLILAWADAYFRRNGEWPTFKSGDIPVSPGDTWNCVDRALRNGIRGLTGGASLARVLAKHRGVRNLSALPRLSESGIARWACKVHANTGIWPTRDSGPIPDAPGETWYAVSNCLVKGYRGLPGGTSLAQLLERRCGVRNRRDLPPLRIKAILSWFDVEYETTGMWPTHVSGPVTAAPGETWSGIHTALQRGCRGLPGGSSLYQVLLKYRGVDRSVRNACRARLRETHS